MSDMLKPTCSHNIEQGKHCPKCPPMTIDPKTLNAEERTIVDAMFLRIFTHPEHDADKCYEMAVGQSEPIILARRALFSPAQPEPKVCDNCHELTRGTHEFEDGRYDCQKPEPVAGELPIELNRACIRLRSTSYRNESPEADAVEQWWARSQATAQPVAVGMSEELRSVLSMASAYVRNLEHGDGVLPEHRALAPKMRAEIAAVNFAAIASAQAASAQPQPPARDLGKVWKVIGWLVQQYGPDEQGYMPSLAMWEEIKAALAELDAQPKAEKVPVEAIHRAMLRADYQDGEEINRWLAQEKGRAG